MRDTQNLSGQAVATQRHAAWLTQQPEARPCTGAGKQAVRYQAQGEQGSGRWGLGLYQPCSLAASGKNPNLSVSVVPPERGENNCVCVKRLSRGHSTYKRQEAGIGSVFLLVALGNTYAVPNVCPIRAAPFPSSCSGVQTHHF